MRLSFALGLMPVCLALFSTNARAATDAAEHVLDLTGSGVGVACIAIFVVAYGLVMSKEYTHLRKSKPVVLAAGLIWMLIGIVYVRHGLPHMAEQALRHGILEYAELFLFLLAAMTYINAMRERRVFDALRAWLVGKGFGYRQLFWITGALAFFISPIAVNLTTALLMCSVVLAVGRDSPKFVILSCINIVVGANAGGAFSPFGDITTLMVWQKGMLAFWEFFDLFVPSAVNFVIPAWLMHFAVPAVKPKPGGEAVAMKDGALIIVALFLLTIATTVSFHNLLNLPPALGMMTGLAYLNFFGYYLKMKHRLAIRHGNGGRDFGGEKEPIDIFRNVARAEWDTLLFFYGVVLCIGGLGFIGYLAIVSDGMYAGLGPTTANVLVGILSAVVDNIPVMFAVLTMQPEMSHGQWLLVTLTAGVGGSLLSIGSAAGVALMGQARGIYTFFGHLKWSWAIALGYAASILCHLWINARFF